MGTPHPLGCCLAMIMTLPLGELAIAPSGQELTKATFSALPHHVTANSQPEPLLAQIPVNARVVHINPVLGSDTRGDGFERTPYQTITHALTQVNGITVIQLAPGSYTQDTGEQFPLTLPPNVILRGDESNQGSTVLLIGGGTIISPTFSRQNVTIAALEDSQIRGLTITNPYTRGTGVWVESSNPVIRNNTFTRSLRDGVFVTGTGDPVIENNRFIDNDGNGVAVAKDARGTIRNNTFENTGFGIAISQNAAPLIDRNTIRDNVDGIVASNNSRPQLRRNVIQGNERDGVVAIANANPDLGNGESAGENVISGNGRYAVYNATASNTILAVGNQIDEAEIEGDVEFVARAIATGFIDTQGHWAEDYIAALAAADIIGGFPDGTYRPNDPVTRAQFAAIITKAFDPSPQRGAIAFSDVSRRFWAYNAIQTAYRGQFVTGYPGNIFRPEQRIPRVQALVALASGLNFDAGTSAALSKYTDAAQIPNWATASIAAATERNLVVSYPNVTVLNPNANATRADVAAFVYQALVNAGKAEPITSQYVVTYP
ncbi:MAG: DUF1565 domain-containing protein [Merismopedia sp. SIO2A8]|nr:DUF1565 domain-containing protein [Merismopedia sp. SIO2A8]